jgi:hypothetical protein
MILAFLKVSDSALLIAPPQKQNRRDRQRFFWGVPFGHNYLNHRH